MLNYLVKVLCLSALFLSFNVFAQSINPNDSLDNPYDSLDNPYDSLDNPYDSLDNPYDSLDNPYDSLDNPYDSLDNPDDTSNNPIDTADYPDDTTDSPDNPIDTNINKIGDTLIISGTVKDSLTGLPLANSKVIVSIIPVGSVKDSTDASGQYKIKLVNLRSGKQVRINASKMPAYSTKIVTLPIDKPSDGITDNITLDFLMSKSKATNVRIPTPLNVTTPSKMISVFSLDGTKIEDKALLKNGNFASQIYINRNFNNKKNVINNTISK